MRPVDSQFEVSQEFGSNATYGVVGDPNGSEVQQLVAEFGNYQPFGHAGMDFAVPYGTPLYAIADGTVLYAGWSDDLPGDDSWGPNGYFQRWALYKFFPGIVTVIQHDGWISVTAHQSDNDAVKVGMRVREGQLIGKSGNTSSRTTTLGAHVHIEALVDMNYPSGNGLIYGRTNPRKFFGTSGAAQATTSKEPFTVTQYEDLGKKLDNITAVLVYGYTSGGKAHPSLAAAIDAIPAHVWNTPVKRGDKLVPALQELADAKTAAYETKTTIADIAKGTASPSIDVKALAAEISTHLTTDQAHQFIIALGQKLTKE